MTATLLAFALGAVLGTIAGAMTLDAYHERQRTVLQAIADAADRERIDARQRTARAESLVESLTLDLARQRAHQRRMDAIFAARLNEHLQYAPENTPTWN